MSYGIEVRDSGGTATVLSPSTRLPSVLAIQAINITNGANVTVPVDMTGLTTSNSSCTIFGQVEGSSAQGVITRVTSGTTGFQITAPSGKTITGTVVVLRY